jgi:hypothetical protein
VVKTIVLLWPDIPDLNLLFPDTYRAGPQPFLLTEITGIAYRVCHIIVHYPEIGFI